MWRRPRLATADTKSPAPQPGRNAWWRGSLRAGPGNGDGGGTWADNATAERREASLPVAREGSCLASVASRVTARQVSRLDVSGRSANPLARGSAATKEKRERKRTRTQQRAGNEETGLFDMVKRKRRGAMHRQGAGAPSRQRQRARVPAERAPRCAFFREAAAPARISRPGDRAWGSGRRGRAGGGFRSRGGARPASARPTPSARG